MKNYHGILFLGIVIFAGSAAAQPPVLLWQSSLNGRANIIDWAAPCMVDDAGHVYAAGMMCNDSMDPDILICRYNAATGGTPGSLVYNNPKRTKDQGLGGAFDAATGSVFISGVIDTGSQQDFILIKTDSLLTDTLWTRRYNGPFANADVGARCALDGSNVIYQVGSSVGQSGKSDFLTIKYNAQTGDTVWTRRYNGPANGDDIGFSCAVNKTTHELYVVGRTFNGVNFDMVTVKYTSSGDTIWTRWQQTGIDTMFITYCFDDCAVDTAGNVYVTGGYSSGGFNGSMMTTKYNANGDTLWIRYYTGVGMSVSWTCAVTPKNELYVGGMLGNGLGGDMGAVKYNAINGDTAWSVRYAGIGPGSGGAQGCAVDAGGNLYLAGFFYNQASKEDFLVCKYNTGTPTGVKGALPVPAGNSVSMIVPSPSPFTERTIIRIPASDGTLSIYSGSGRLVRSFDLQSKPADFAVWDGSDNKGAQVPPGLYICHAKAGGNSMMQAVIRQK